MSGGVVLNPVGSGSISDGAITTAKLADNAVDGTKLGIGTTAGDTISFDGTDWTRKAIGANNQIYRTNDGATDVEWENYGIGSLAAIKEDINAGGDDTTTSTTFVDTSYTLTFDTTTIGVTSIYAIFSGYALASNSSNSTILRLTIGGVNSNELTAIGITTAASCALAASESNVAGGSTTVKAQFRVNGAITGTVGGGSIGLLTAQFYRGNIA